MCEYNNNCFYADYCANGIKKTRVVDIRSVAAEVAKKFGSGIDFLSLQSTLENPAYLVKFIKWEQLHHSGNDCFKLSPFIVEVAYA